MKAVSDVKLNYLVQKLGSALNAKLSKSAIQIVEGSSVEDLPTNVADGTIVFLILE